MHPLFCLPGFNCNTDTDAAPIKLEVVHVMFICIHTCNYLFRLVCIRPIPKNKMTKIKENTGMKISAICLEILRYFSFFTVGILLVLIKFIP